MNLTKGTFYGVVGALTALLIISSSLALYYYDQEQSVSQQEQYYIGVLDSSLASYRALAGSYNVSLKDMNITLSLLATAVSNLNTSTPAYGNASSALPTLWKSYQLLASYQGRRALTYSVHLLVDYGNGTKVWYNETSAQPGWNGYVVSLVLLDGKIDAQWYPAYGEHFVTGINGVSGSDTTSWFVWDHEGGLWTVSQTGVDQIQIHNGTVMAWTLCGYDSNFSPSCSP